MRLRSWLLLFGVVICAALVAFLWRGRDRRPAASAPVQRPPVGSIYQIAPRLYVVPGGGGNTAVFVRADGVLLVDTKYSVNWEDLAAQVRTVTDAPITHVINTHCHGDHAGGNWSMPPGIEVVVQEHTAANLDALAREAGQPLPARPRRTFTDRLTLFEGEDAVDLYHFGPAHTDGDAIVVFRAARVAHTGDVFPGKEAPIVNIEWGGNGVTYPTVLARALAEIPDVDRIITGHGGVLPASELQRFAALDQALVDHVRTHIRFGRDKGPVFRAFVPPGDYADYNLHRLFNTMDEIDRSLRPWWQRVWS